eukprot:CAMPEP_0114277706 /NCGR_PEP_ID=MMETSP0059-20121206/943_1 /TAXON_ID=36894 /ORGANISM="Pyramimonas parkeae, Strain CCMP726" /LENGTH=327 /DNA_ID=CAMNT_0001397849 /DNA_START=197 /DNA_END=1180 /DNA_ORIENTATION=-
MSADSTGLNAGASLPRDSLTWEPQQSPQQSPAGAHDPAQERTSSALRRSRARRLLALLPASRSFNAGRSLRGPTPAADIDMDSAVEPWVDAGGGEELQDLPRAPQRSSGGVPAGGDRNRSPASDCDAPAALGHRRPGTADRGGACKARRRPARAKSARQSGGLGSPTRQRVRRGKAEGHHLDRIAYEPPPEARVVKRRDACMALFGRCAARPGTAGPAVRPAQAIPVQGGPSTPPYSPMLGISAPPSFSPDRDVRLDLRALQAQLGQADCARVVQGAWAQHPPSAAAAGKQHGLGGRGGGGGGPCDANYSTENALYVSRTWYSEACL